MKVAVLVRKMMMGALVAAPVLVQASNPTAPALEGVWRGALAVGGGSQLVQVTVMERAGNRIAVLDVPAQGLVQVPMKTTERGDSLFFDNYQTDHHFSALRSADGQVMPGKWRQRGSAAPLLLRFSGVPAIVPKSMTAAPNYRAEEMSLPVPAANLKLTGTLTLPEGTGPFPAAILLSDIGPDDRDARHGDYQLLGTLADYLARQGIATLRFDDRGVGQSGGTATTTTMADRLADVTVALNQLRTNPKIDAARLGLIGHGQGADVALQAATPLSPSFVVALAASGLPARELLARQPVMYGKVLGADTTEASHRHEMLVAQEVTLREVAKMRAQGANSAQVDTYVDQQRLRQKSAERKYQDALMKHQRAMLEIVRQTPDNGQAQAILGNMLRQRYPALNPNDLQTSLAQLTTPAYRDYLKFDPLPNLEQTKCPILLLSGTADTEVNAAANLELLQKAMKNNARVAARQLDGVNHAFQTPATSGQPQVSAEAESAIRDWVQAQVGK